MYTRSRKTTSVKRHGLSRPAYITDPYRGLSSHQAGSTPHRLTRNDVDFRISDDPVFFHVQNTRNVCPTTHPDQNWNNARSNYKTNIEHRKLEQTRHWAQRRVSSTKKKRLQPSSHTNEYNTKSARGQISCVILYRYDVSSEFKQRGPHVFGLALIPMQTLMDAAWLPAHSRHTQEPASVVSYIIPSKSLRRGSAIAILPA